MERIRNISILALLLLIASSGQNLTAQENLYYLEGVPQRYQLNPAFRPECSFFIGVPVASSMYMDIENSAFGINELFWNDPISGEVIHPLHPNADFDDFLTLFDDANYMAVRSDINLLSFGFKTKEMFFAFDMTSKMSEHLTYPKALIELLQGVENGETHDFSNLNIDAVNHIEYGVTISRSFGDQWSVGVRPKMLAGIAAIQSKDVDITLQTSTNQWVLNSKFETNMAIAGVEIPVDEDGVIDPEGEFEFDSTLNDVKGYSKLLTKNIGFGIDMGATYRPIDYVEVSISLLDLGYIKWKDYNHTITQDGSYTWDAFDLGLNDSLDFADYFLDSLKHNLEVEGESKPFKTTLSPKLFIGGRFFATPHLDLGVLSKTEFFKTSIRQDFIFSANWRPSRVFSVSGNYSFMNGQEHSFGLGLSFLIGPLNIYMISDNIPFSYNSSKKIPVPLPNNLRSYNFRAGVNFVFGCNQNKKLRKDKPLLYSEENWAY